MGAALCRRLYAAAYMHAPDDAAVAQLLAALAVDRVPKSGKSRNANAWKGR